MLYMARHWIMTTYKALTGKTVPLVPPGGRKSWPLCHLLAQRSNVPNQTEKPTIRARGSSWHKHYSIAMHRSAQLKDIASERDFGHSFLTWPDLQAIMDETSYPRGLIISHRGRPMGDPSTMIRWSPVTQFDILQPLQVWLNFPPKWSHTSSIIEEVF